MHLTTEVFPGNSVSLRLHNLLPGLTSLISEEISIELKNLHTEHVRSFLRLVPSLSGYFECCLHCNNLGWRGILALCPSGLLGLV